MIKKFVNPMPLVVMLGSFTVSGCAITDIPSKSNVERELPLARTSVIAAQAQFPMSKVEQILESKLPVSNRFKGRENGACKAEVNLGGVIGITVKVGDIEWEVSYTRTKFRVFNASNDRIGVQSTFTIHAKVKCIVEVLNQEIFNVQESTDPDGILDLTITIGASIGELYKPESNFGHNCCNWNRVPAFRAIFDLIEVTIETVSTEGLREALDQAGREIKNKINQVALRKSAQDLWEVLHKPVQIHEPSDTWIESRPLSLHASGLQAEKTHAKVTVAARSNLRISVGQKPEPSDLVALPILSKNIPSDRFGLYVPIALPYTTLEKLFHENVGGKFIAVEEGTFRLDEFLIYQSGEKLAVGVRFVATPRNFLPVRGILYFSGTPSLDVNGKILEFPDLDYSANFDNPLYYIIDWVFHAEFKEKLRTAMKLNLQPEVQKWQDKLADLGPIEIAPGIMLNGTLDEFALDYLIPDSMNLALRLSATGSASVNVDLDVP